MSVLKISSYVTLNMTKTPPQPKHKIFHLFLISCKIFLNFRFESCSSGTWCRRRLSKRSDGFLRIYQDPSTRLNGSRRWRIMHSYILSIVSQQKFVSTRQKISSLKDRKLKFLGKQIICMKFNIMVTMGTPNRGTCFQVSQIIGVLQAPGHTYKYLG